MASPVMDIMTNNIDELYSQLQVRHRVEDHLTRLISTGVTVQVDEQSRHRYEYDFYNLLTMLGYTNNAHYAILRMNGFTNPNQYRVTDEYLIVPDQDDLRWLHDIHRIYKRYGSQ